MKWHRSPGYPAVSLKTAIKKAQMLYDHDRQSKVPVSVATQHLGYTVGSGIGLRTIAALRHFGLLEATGRNDSRQVWLSERALDIVLSPTDAEKRCSAIRIAALAPTIHSDVWKFFNGELPSDAALQSYLVRDREFNDAHVGKVIEEIRDTFTFAELSNSNLMENDEASGDGVNGQEDNGKHRDDHQREHKSNRRGRRRTQRGTKEAVFPMATGDVVLQWPEGISPEEAEDLDDWLDVMKRKLKRSVVVVDESQAPATGPNNSSCRDSGQTKLSEPKPPS